MQAAPKVRPQVRVPVPATPAAPADAARQDRFLRQLMPLPWDEAAEAQAFELDVFDAPVDAVDEGAGDGSPPRGEEDKRDGDEAQETAPPPPPESPDPLPAALPPWPWMRSAGLAGERGGSETPHDSPMPAATGVAPDGDAPPWLGDIVEQVTSLTAGSDARFQHWAITVPLDPQALPDSELRLTLSPGTMALRFRTGSGDAAALVSRHRDALRARLEALPSSPPAIDIDLE